MNRTPQHAPARLDTQLHNWNLNGHPDARYAVYAAPPHDMKGAATLVARWQKHGDAQAIAKRLTDHFSDPSRGGLLGACFGIELEMPIAHLESEGKATIGDLMLVQVTREAGLLMASKQFWAVKHVYAALQGRVQGFNDNTGRHWEEAFVPARSIIVPAAQFDMRHAERCLIERAGERTLYEGEFSSPKHVLHTIRPALRVKAPSLATVAEISQYFEPYRKQWSALVCSKELALA